MNGFPAAAAVEIEAVDDHPGERIWGTPAPTPVFWQAIDKSGTSVASSIELAPSIGVRRAGFYCFNRMKDLVSNAPERSFP
jgi:hypothetical protein